MDGRLECGSEVMDEWMDGLLQVLRVGSMWRRGKSVLSVGDDRDMYGDVNSAVERRAH